jgi:UDP:flavonoid glycosyltransferase YjiC (YdhE family)
MKILIAPMVCPFETAGPAQRVAILAKAFSDAGHEVAFCAAEDSNYQPVEGVENFPSIIPEPLGLPRPLGKIAAFLAFKSGMLKRKEITSFEQVLHILGILNPGYFFRDLEILRQTIKEYKPDIVYSEFRMAALVAAKLENVILAGSCSCPALPSYRRNPEYSVAVRKKLAQMGLPELESILDLFYWQAKSFIPSSPMLEEIAMENAIYTGPLISRNLQSALCATK